MRVFGRFGEGRVVGVIEQIGGQVVGEEDAVDVELHGIERRVGRGVIGDGGRVFVDQGDRGGDRRDGEGGGWCCHALIIAWAGVEVKAGGSIEGGNS